MLLCIDSSLALHNVLCLVADRRKVAALILSYYCLDGPALWFCLSLTLYQMKF